MSKKFVPIIAGIVAVIAIVVIAIIGANPDIFNKNVYVTEIKIKNDIFDTYELESATISRILMSEDNTTVVSGKKTFTIEWEVLPEKATDKTVTFTSSNADIATVSTEGVVTFEQEDAVFITIKSNDKSAKTATVQLMWPAERTSSLSVALDNGNLKFEAESDTQFYTVESDTLYLYKGVEYIFASDAEVSIPSTSVASMESKVLTTSATGEFDMTFKFDEETTKTQKVVVVEYINSFGYGTSYSAYKNTVASLATNENFMNKTIQEYEVGANSPYYFDIVAQNEEFQVVSLADSHLEYSVKEVVGQEKTPVANSDVFTLDNDKKLVFSANAIGKTYEFTVTPKYNFLNKAPLTFQVKVVEGVNVWTHEQLQEKFGDLSVNAIVMHSNVVATAKAEQLDPDGRLINKDDLYSNASNGTRQTTGDIYARAINQTARNTYQNLDLTLSGNYFKVDATSLPYLTINEEYSSHDPLSWTVEAGYPAASMQTGIFKIQDDSGDAYDYNTPNKKVINFNVKNFVLEGNTSTGVLYEVDENGDLIDVDEYEQIALQGSASAGFMQRGAVKIHTDNIAVFKTGIGLYSTGSLGGITTKNTFVYDSWANAAYGWRTGKFVFEDSKFEKCGGAAICVTDATHTDKYSAEWMDAEITFGKNFAVDNFVTGTEGYFVANGLNTAVTSLKAQLDPAINGAGKTIIKKVEIPGEATPLEYFNFILQVNAEANQCRTYKFNRDNIGSADGWEIYQDGFTWVREGTELYNKNNPTQRYTITGTTCTFTFDLDSQITLNYYNEGTNDYTTIVRKSGYYDVSNYPLMGGDAKTGLEGMSKITNIDDAYLIAGLVASHNPQTYDPTVVGSVDSLLGGDEEVVNIVNSLNLGITAVSIRSVIDANIAAAIGAGVDPSNQQQYMMAVCRSNILDVIEANKALYNMILANPAYESRHAEVEYLIAGFDMVVANAKARAELAPLCVALTLNNDLVALKNADGEDVNVIQAKIRNELLGDFAGIMIHAQIMDYVEE